MTIRALPTLVKKSNSRAEIEVEVNLKSSTSLQPQPSSSPENLDPALPIFLENLRKSCGKLRKIAEIAENCGTLRAAISPLLFVN